MVISLDGLFSKALSDKENGVTSNIHAVVNILKNAFPQAKVDWEEGDENWARLLGDGNEVFLLINALFPLVFVRSDFYDTVRCQLPSCQLPSCQLFPVESFFIENFNIDKRLLERVIGRELSGNVNYEKLSIDDLWWATI